MLAAGRRCMVGMEGRNSPSDHQASMALKQGFQAELVLNTYLSSTESYQKDQYAAASDRPVSRLPPPLLQHPNPPHHHPLVHRLAHIVDRQQTDLNGGQGFHFHAGLAF